jgi:hypothetical protein
MKLLCVLPRAILFALDISDKKCYITFEVTGLLIVVV